MNEEQQTTQMQGDIPAALPARVRLFSLVYILIITAIGAAATLVLMAQIDIADKESRRPRDFVVYIERMPEKARSDPANADAVNPTPSEVEGWQTYRNEEYGLEFSYPEAWIIRKPLEKWGIKPFPSDNVVDVKNVVTMMPPPHPQGYGYAMTLAIIDEPEYLINRNYDIYIPERDTRGRLYFEDDNKPYTLSGSPGRQVDVSIPIGTATERRILIPNAHNSTLILIISGIYENEFTDEYQHEQGQFNQVLSTFKFTEPDSSMPLSPEEVLMQSELLDGNEVVVVGMVTLIQDFSALDGLSPVFKTSNGVLHISRVSRVMAIFGGGVESAPMRIQGIYNATDNFLIVDPECFECVFVTG